MGDAGSQRWRGLTAVLVGLAFCIPALTVGFVFDDLIHRLALEGDLPGMKAGWWSLYDFATNQSLPKLIDLGAFPWFTSPELSLRLFRPLSSATLALDAALFGRRPFPAHLHTLVWFGLLVGFTGLLYRRWLRPRVARWAAILYAVSGVHALPTAWLASRHTLVAAVFSVVALWGWARWREEHWRPGAAVAGAALTASLLSSEAWLAGLAFLVLYEGLGPRPWRARLVGVAPLFGLGAIYAIAYGALDYGIRGSAMYISPLHKPGAYLRAAAVRLPLAYAELFGGAPSILGGADPSVRWILVGWGVGALGAAGAALYALRRRIRAADRFPLLWLGAAAAVSPLLLVGTAVTGRVLPVPLVGAAAVLAQVLVAAWETLRDATARRRWPAALPLLLFGAGHGIFSPMTRLGLPLVFGATGKMHAKVAREADLGTCFDGGRIYLLTAADPALSLYLGPSLAFYRPRSPHAERLRVLTVIPHDLELTRISDRAFELTVLDLPRRTNEFELLYRPSSSPLEPGQSFTVEELRVEVLETSRGLMTQARFELDASLDSPSSCFIAWHDQRIAPVRMPPVGQSVTLPHEKGPAGL